MNRFLFFVLCSLFMGLSASAENSNEKDMARPYLMKVIKKGNDIYVRTSLSAINDIVIKMYQVQNNMTFHTFYVGAKELSDTEITNGSYPIRNIGDIVGAIGIDTFWFLYAQHGWTIPKMASCGHLLDNNDIGSIWKDQNDRRFIVGKVDDEYIYLLPELTKDANTDVYRASWNGSLQYPTELTHVSGAVHTDVILGSSSRYDLVIQTSQNRKFIADGVEIQDNGEYYCDEFVIKEHIIGHNIGKVQAWFPTPQYNGSLIDFDRCFTFKGSNVTYNMVINTQYPFVLTDYRGCIPTMPLQVGNYHSYTFIPKVKKQVNGHRVDLPFNSDDGTIGPNYVSVVRNTADLYNIDDQPERCITYLKDISGNYLVGMAGGGSLLRGISTRENRNVFVPEGKSTCTYGGASTPNKFYPKMLQAARFTDRIVPNSFTQEFCCYYCWFDPNANEGQVYWYKDGSNYVIYAHCQKEHDRLAISVPHFMDGQNLSVIEKTDNAELLSETVLDSKFFVKYNTSEANYLVVGIPINKYKLVYMLDGAEYRTQEIEYGAKITPEPAPTKGGYTFSGWSEIPSTMPNKDVTITGDFTINKYRLVYMVDGAEYKSMEVEYGATISPEPAPAKEGYTFSGWSNIPTTMPANDVMVMGSFKEAAGIINIIIDSPGVHIYEMLGNRIDQVKKGINIIRLDDGRAKKVVIK